MSVTAMVIVHNPEPGSTRTRRFDSHCAVFLSQGDTGVSLAFRTWEEARDYAFSVYLAVGKAMTAEQPSLPLDIDPAAWSELHAEVPS